VESGLRTLELTLDGLIPFALIGRLRVSMIVDKKR